MNSFLSGLTLGVIAGGAVFGVIGFWLRAHIGSLASGVSRATTLPGHVVDQLNQASSGLGDAMQKAVGAASAPIVVAVGDVAKSAEKAAG